MRDCRLNFVHSEGCRRSSTDASDGRIGVVAPAQEHFVAVKDLRPVKV